MNVSSLFYSSTRALTAGDNGLPIFLLFSICPSLSLISGPVSPFAEWNWSLCLKSEGSEGSASLEKAVQDSEVLHCLLQWPSFRHKHSNLCFHFLSSSITFLFQFFTQIQQHWAELSCQLSVYSTLTFLFLTHDTILSSGFDVGTDVLNRLFCGWHHGNHFLYLLPQLPNNLNPATAQ